MATLPSIRSTTALLLALGAFGCGGDPKQIRIGTGPPEAVLAQLEHRQGLTVEETRLLHGYFARTRLEMIEGTVPAPTGRTVGELIAEQRSWEQAHQNVIAERRHQASEWKARAGRVVAEMENVLSVRVVESRDAEPEPEAKGHSRSLVVKLQIENVGNRPIAEAEGAVRFTDVYGRDLFDCSVVIREPIPPGERIERALLLDCAPFMDEETRVRQVRLTETKAVWEPRVLRFEDGGVLTLPDE